MAGLLQAEFLETFEGHPVGRSLYTKDGSWKKFGSGDQAQPKSNTAIVRSQEGRRYVTLLAHGHQTANSRAYYNVDLPVSDTQNNRISAEIRYATPDTPNEIPSSVNLALNASKVGQFDPDGVLNMGIMNEDGALAFYFIFGGTKDRRIVSRSDQVMVKPDAWYRFEVQVHPSSGRCSFSVYELNGEEKKEIWAGDNAGHPNYSPEKYSQVNLMVARPGSNEAFVRSADFSNISIGK